MVNLEERHVLLGCKRGEKYKKYKSNVQPSISDTKKCNCPFKLRDKPIGNEEGWVLKEIHGYHNHDLSKTLVGHSFVGRLKSNEQSLFINMTKSEVKFANIPHTLDKNNKHSVTRDSKKIRVRG